jgi:Rab9 effector protein with kelch motifs
VSNGDAGSKPREAETERRNPFLRGLGKWMLDARIPAFHSTGVTVLLKSVLPTFFFTSSENCRLKRRTGDIRPNEAESEEEHSLSLSQHSSPSQSDQEQNGAHKLSASPSASISALQPFVRLNSNGTLRAPGPRGISSRPLKTDQLLRTIAPQHRPEVEFLSSDHKPQPRPSGAPLVCCSALN